MLHPTRIIGVDPGLRRCGWALIDVSGNRLSPVASGAVTPKTTLALSERLLALQAGLAAVIDQYRPHEAAVEETFVNQGARSALLLGQARGIALLVPAMAGLVVAEYAANLVKKSVVGTGHADKGQIGMMVKMLLPGADIKSEDAADAFAIAICHAHHRTSRARLAQSA